jgi:ubiquinone/menaquinone biosynthesis C-methylase UbiE
MNHQDHVDLLRMGVPGPGGAWADLGCGSGAFTLALAELLGPNAVVYAVDRDPTALERLREAMRRRFPGYEVRAQKADFSRSLSLPALDGIVMANSLHFCREKEPILRSARGMLRETGRFILVEYNADRGNPWVPFPISWRTWQGLAAACGFAHTEKIAAKPSSFLREIYSAVSF